MALVYHTVSREFKRDQTPLQQGRYALQPGQKLFKFKRTFLLKELEGDDGVDCVSSDGLAIRLDVTFQYRIRLDSLVEMFLLLGEDYENVIFLQAVAAIRDSCGNFGSNEFYYSRQQVQDDMNLRVDAKLDEVFCDGGFLQLINVQFDSSFIDAVQHTQAAIQDITQAQNERQQALIQARTRVLQSEQYASVTLTRANADAQVTLANANAQAMSINATLSAQLDAYSSIMETLGLGGESLINYIAIQFMQRTNQITLNIDPPAHFTFPSA